MRLLGMEDMLLAAERGEVSESRIGPLYAALCALPSCARGFLSGDVVVRVTWALGAVASQVMRGLCPKHELWSARRCCRARRLGLSCCCVARRRPRSRRESGVEVREGRALGSWAVGGGATTVACCRWPVTAGSEGQKHPKTRLRWRSTEEVWSFDRAAPIRKLCCVQDGQGCAAPGGWASEPR